MIFFFGSNLIIIKNRNFTNSSIQIGIKKYINLKLLLVTN